jgi:uncharacterized coiled-coil DUF342 family protein
LDNQFLIKLNDTLDKVIEKIDKQSIQIQDLTNKIDFYREAQNEHARKLEGVDTMTKEAHASTKAAHKRLDGFEGSIKDLEQTIEDYIEGQRDKEQEQEKERKDNAKWLKRAIVGAILGWSSVILGALLKLFGG